MTHERRFTEESQLSSASGTMDIGEPMAPEDDGRRRCTATVRSTGQRCKKFPIKFATQCASHNNAPQVRAAAKRREIEAGAMVALSRSNIEPLTDPLQALLDLGAEMIAFKDLLGTQVERLNAADLTHVDRQGQQFIAAVANSFSAAMKDAVQLLVQINKLGILERRQRLDEAEYRSIVECIHTAVLSPTADLTDDQAHRTLVAIRDELARTDLY